MIRKIATSPINTRFITTSLVISSLLCGIATADAGNKNNKRKNITTEVVSKDVAQSLQSNIFNLGTFSQEHNRKLDRAFLKIIDSKTSSKDKKQYLDSLYNNLGTFGATIELQRNIDDYYMQNTFEIFCGHYNFTNKDIIKIEEMSSKFNQWKEEVLYPGLEQKEKALQTDSFLSAEKAIEIVDKHLLNKTFFIDGDFDIYNSACENFKSKQTDKNSAMSKSDLLAYKVHILNALAFKNFINSRDDNTDSHIFNYYYHRYFINGEASIKP